MVSCICCGISHNSRKRGIHFHRFPKGLEQRKAWLAFVNKDETSIPKTCYICSQHFDENCFDRTSQLKVALRKNAVPTKVILRRKYARSMVRPTLQSPDAEALKLASSLQTTETYMSPSVAPTTPRASTSYSSGTHVSVKIEPFLSEPAIKTALDKDNLHSEIEEKLLQLQYYQENEMMQEPEAPPIVSQPNSQVAAITSVRVPTRKRPPSSKEDDAEWVMETPKRSRFTKNNEIIKKEESHVLHSIKDKSINLDEKSVAMKANILMAFCRQKEALKKEIRRKRVLLERELRYEIQKEVSDEIAVRIRLERSRQDEMRSGESRRSLTVAPTPPQAPPTTPTAVSSSNTAVAPSTSNPKISAQPKRSQRQHSSSSGGSGRNKEKVYCICRTSYDETKCYVGCDLCNNWFHGDCVGITEESSKTMTEFICSECKHARDTAVSSSNTTVTPSTSNPKISAQPKRSQRQHSSSSAGSGRNKEKVYCICRTPYDETKCYVGCDLCNNWFHGDCVGITEESSKTMTEFICSECKHARDTAVSSSNTTVTPSTSNPKISAQPKRSQRQHSSSSGGSGRNKEKVYCICRTSYDETKCYVGCDLCNNWFHGDCVGITEESSKTMTEFICSECKHARDTQEIFCLCRQPYDESQFCICCDSCQDWFHGRCVGILQSEAENIDEYVCPNCQKNSSVNFANMKNLTDKDFGDLRKLIKQLQCHKSAWPFMEPVDPNEAPDYFRVIKEPMDLQKIENKITEQSYNKLSEFIGDMTKIFDNCRYYNPKESLFFKCAESLEAYFVNKIQFLREKLSENNEQ